MDERLDYLLSDDILHEFDQQRRDLTRQEREDEKKRKQNDDMFQHTVQRELQELKVRNRTYDENNETFLNAFKQANKNFSNEHVKVRQAYDKLIQLKDENIDYITYYFPVIAEGQMLLRRQQPVDKQIERYQKIKQDEVNQSKALADQKDEPIDLSYYEEIKKLPFQPGYTKPATDVHTKSPSKKTNVTPTRVNPPPRHNPTALENNSMTYSQEVTQSQLQKGANQDGRQSFGGQLKKPQPARSQFNYNDYNDDEEEEF